jgi:hypothetical protein
MTKFSKNDLKKHLLTLTEEQLRQEVLRLYDKISSVKTYYQAELGNSEDHQALLKQYQAKISKLLNISSRRSRPKVTDAWALVKEFGKICFFPHLQAELMLFQLETMECLSRQEGYLGQTYNLQLRRYFEEMLLFVMEQKLQRHLEQRIKALALACDDNFYTFDLDLLQVTELYFDF